MGKETIDVLIQGGKATPAPPLGPGLSPLKINVGRVIADINEKTKTFQGMEVPVKITVDTETKEYTITVGTPPVTSMLRKSMGKEKLRSKKEEMQTEGGDVSLSKLVEIAKAKESALASHSISGNVKQILGTCLSGGVTVNGKDPRLVQKEIDEGKIKL